MRPTLIITIFLSASMVATAQNASQKVKEANNKIAPILYKEVAQNAKGNFLLSPFSAETALALLQSGSEGSTGTELREQLRFPNNKTEIEEGYKDLLPQLRSTQSYTFLTANKIYVSTRFSVRDSFKEVASQVYDAEAENIDFSQNTEAADEINQWVEAHTDNKIQNLVSPDNLDASTVVVLVNTLYFNASWASPFPTSGTVKKNFYITETEAVQVDTMHQVEKYFNYYECSKLQVQIVELPFQGGKASMFFALPFAKNGLPNLEKRIAVILSNRINYRSQYLNVAIPKFKIDFLVALKEILQNIGVRKIFEPAEADLSGISGQKGEVSVSDVRQKTYISVVEGGVEAAAATAVGMGVVALTAVLGPPPKEFIADHPFFFWIKVDGVIVFVGRVADPRAE